MELRHFFSLRKVKAEASFKKTLLITSILMIVIAIAIFLTLVVHSVPSLKALGIKYLWGRTWDPVSNVYGGLPFLLGTLLTSFLALFISIPFSYAIAIYLGEYKTTGWLPGFLRNIVELVAPVELKAPAGALSPQPSSADAPPRDR